MKITRRKIELIILGISIVGLLVYAHYFEISHIYFPEKFTENSLNPSQYGLKYEDITFVTEDKERINAWYVPAENPVALFLFCHGNAGNDVDRLVTIEEFHRLHISVFIFDYRGYGKSSGSPNEKGTYRDAMSAYTYLKNRKDIDMKKVILYGESMGGAIAIDLAAKVKPAGMIIVSSFTSIQTISKELYPVLPIRWLMWTKYNSLSKMKNIHCPVLICHSKQDDIIPFHHGQDLYNAANPPKEFLELHGTHGDTLFFSEKPAIEKIKEFINKTVTQS